jgi:hypothetical protein
VSCGRIAGDRIRSIVRRTSAGSENRAQRQQVAIVLFGLATAAFEAARNRS